MKNIYDMLNEVEINLDELEKEDFNDIEKQRIKNKFRQSINSKKIKKSNNYNKYIAVASVVIISFTIFSKTEIGSYANEKVIQIVYGIKEALGINNDISLYTTNVNQSITKKGITIKINDVILDRDELLIHITKTYNGELDKYESIDLSSERLMINGKLINKGNRGYFIKTNNNTEELIIGYKLDEDDYKGDIKVKLRIGDVYLSKTIEESKRIFGPWVFKFKVNSDKLKDITKEVDINDNIELKDGSSLNIDKYRSNILRQELHLNIKIPENMKDKSEGWIYNDIVLKGKDDLGNEIILKSSEGNYDSKKGEYYKGIYKLENDYILSENVKKLYLTPYLEKYTYENNEDKRMYEKMGEEFTIDISEK